MSRQIWGFTVWRQSQLGYQVLAKGLDLSTGCFRCVCFSKMSFCATFQSFSFNSTPKKLDVKLWPSGYGQTALSPVWSGCNLKLLDVSPWLTSFTQSFLGPSNLTDTPQPWPLREPMNYQQRADLNRTESSVRRAHTTRVLRAQISEICCR